MLAKGRHGLGETGGVETEVFAKDAGALFEFVSFGVPFAAWVDVLKALDVEVLQAFEALYISAHFVA